MYTNILLQAGTTQSGGSMWIPLILMAVVFYFFMILPQSRKNKKTKKFLEELSKGDKVITLSGIHGKVASIDSEGTTIILEVEDGSKLKLEKSAISPDLSAPLNK